ncbi:MAG TPA: hypothetical protein VIZ69_00020, partial [Thermoanaerobaculia bacterium]
RQVEPLPRFARRGGPAPGRRVSADRLAAARQSRDVRESVGVAGARKSVEMEAERAERVLEFLARRAPDEDLDRLQPVERAGDELPPEIEQGP